MEKYSKQREEILNLVKNSYSHPTAEEIYLKVKETYPHISRGTVYRNLNYLTEKGTIIKISMQDGPDRYDYLENEHMHAICTKCSKVFDFTYDFKTQNIENEISNKSSLKFQITDIVLKGICENCSKKNQK